ncbi:MAG: hypothetical protein IPO19_14025 [Rhodoferax sp.]|nr:hypothetical protein [Rhodoferax sp.]
MRSYTRIYPKDQLGQLPHIDRVNAAIQHDSHWAISTQLQSAEAFCEAEGIQLGVGGKPNGLRPNCDERWLYALLSGDVTPCCQVKQVLDPDWNLTRNNVQQILSNPHYENTRFNLWNGVSRTIARAASKRRCPASRPHERAQPADGQQSGLLEWPL